MISNSLISKNFKKLRKDFNLSQEELGKKLSLSRQMISALENELALPSLDTLDKLNELYNIDIASFLYVEGNFYKNNNPKQIKKFGIKEFFKNLKSYYYFLFTSLFFLVLIITLLLIAFLNPLYIHYALSYKWWFIYFETTSTITFNVFFYIFIFVAIISYIMFLKGLIYEKKKHK